MAFPSAVIRFAVIMLLVKQVVWSVVLQLLDLVGFLRMMSLTVLKSPFRSACVGIVRDTEELRRRMYLNSVPPKKKSLSLMIGPPIAKPKSLKRSVGFATPLALLMNELASSLSLRK